ncbi:M15 family metallopeptidase [Dysgonomonas sp. 520]|uniref:M15 family metallopeptidase n=1 Tax=Dysgonomonas sp. 520 TaxID=2302931 RepID=UPI0013D7B2C3|nr:M15 family metallopeptidase [Dysgonomonas sp. 520]NDW08141.1 D-alanyl-D-alanine dipeptidase [Dysgonomonas sp. 520]
MIRLFLIIVWISVCYVSCVGKTNNIDKQTVSDDPKVHTTDSIAQPEPIISCLEQKMIDQGLICVNHLDSSLVVDLKYATTDNFTKVVLYDTLSNAYLHPLAAEKLIKAQKLLKEIDPNLSLLIYDAARPLSVQKKMFQVVQGTKYQAYVANPSRTGLHNYGIAVDLTICDLSGNALDMGTPFDFFGKEAGITNEAAFLTKKQIENRNLLRKVMTGAGFLTIRGEWWHFNALSLADAKKTCRLIE